MIDKISDDQLREEYAGKWEALEVEATRAGFDNVFAHIRMIYSKKKAKRSLNEEFQEYVIGTGVSSESLIDDILMPCTDAYLQLTTCSYKSSAEEDAEAVNESLGWLNRIDNTDWLPAAIKFLSEKKEHSEYAAWFFAKLERLAAYFHTTSKSVNQRINRYAELLSEMDEKPNHNLSNRLQSIELTDAEKEEFLTALNEDVYLKTARKRNYILLRLDSFLSDGAASYASKSLTIEHVLPQTVDDESEWARMWPDKDVRQKWLNKIANLVLLSRRKNSQAKNFDFETKKGKYFSSKNGTSSFALTTQVLSLPAWTPEIVAKRQEELIELLKEKWEL